MIKVSTFEFTVVVVVVVVVIEVPQALCTRPSLTVESKYKYLFNKYNRC